MEIISSEPHGRVIWMGCLLGSSDVTIFRFSLGYIHQQRVFHSSSDGGVLSDYVLVLRRRNMGTFALYLLQTQCLIYDMFPPHPRWILPGQRHSYFLLWGMLKIYKSREGNTVNSHVPIIQVHQFSLDGYFSLLCILQSPSSDYFKQILDISVLCSPETGLWSFVNEEGESRYLTP